MSVRHWPVCHTFIFGWVWTTLPTKNYSSSSHCRFFTKGQFHCVELHNRLQRKYQWIHFEFGECAYPHTGQDKSGERRYCYTSLTFKNSNNLPISLTSLMMMTWACCITKATPANWPSTCLLFSTCRLSLSVQSSNAAVSTCKPSWNAPQRSIQSCIRPLFKNTRETKGNNGLVESSSTLSLCVILKKDFRRNWGGKSVVRLIALTSLDSPLFASWTLTGPSAFCFLTTTVPIWPFECLASTRPVTCTQYPKLNSIMIINHRFR
jgi:hypothetical protein